MKLSIALILISLNSLAIDYNCKVKGARQPGANLLSSGELKVNETIESSLRSITVNGLIAVDHDYNTRENNELNYQGSFLNIKRIERHNYCPRVYVGYSKFDDFDATDTTTYDGGGMFGYLVIEKDTSKPVFKAHYIFQSGDHLGGTIDLECRR